MFKGSVEHLQVRKPTLVEGPNLVFCRVADIEVFGPIIVVAIDTLVDRASGDLSKLNDLPLFLS